MIQQKKTQKMPVVHNVVYFPFNTQSIKSSLKKVDMDLMTA